MTLNIEGDAIGGQLLGAQRRPGPTFAPGRVCSQPGCETVLSIYNSNSRCALHDFDTNLWQRPAPGRPRRIDQAVKEQVQARPHAA